MLFAMQIARTLVALLALSALSAAQQTRNEIVKPTTPEQDSKPNSAAVPEVYAIPARIERVLVLRFKYEADLLAGIERMVKEHKIRNAVILSGIGSVRNYHIHQVSNRSFPSKNMFVRDPTAPADVIGMNGYIIDGRVHAHLTMSNAEGAFGGHLEPGTNVFTFAVLTLGVLGDSVDLGKVDDKTYR